MRECAACRRLFIPRSGNYRSQSEFVSVRPSADAIFQGQLSLVSSWQYTFAALLAHTNKQAANSRTQFSLWRVRPAARPAKQTNGELSSQFSTHPSSYFLPHFISLFPVLRTGRIFMALCVPFFIHSSHDFFTVVHSPRTCKKVKTNLVLWFEWARPKVLFREQLWASLNISIKLYDYIIH